MKFTKYILAFSLLTLVLVSCRVTKEYSRPEVDTNGLYRGVEGTDTNTIANLGWNEIFTDPILQQHIATAIERNPDLLMAYTRVEQARAYYQQSQAAFLPSLNANAGVTESKLSEVQGFGIRSSSSQFQLGLSSSWEADIWGRLSSSRSASLASLLQSRAASRAVQTGLIATVANLYYRLLALDRQLQITEQTVSNWDTTVRTMRALKQSARVTEAAVVQSEAQRYAAEVTIPDLKQSIRETEHAFSILLGNAPDAVERTALEQQQPIEMTQTGVPSQLLSNRPDVQQAEYNFMYAFELTNVARTNFYPSLLITANAGLSSLSLARLFDIGSLAASIGAGLTQPIFNRRANKTTLEVAQLQQQEALLNFKNTLLQAGAEVSDALSLQKAAAEKVSLRNSQISSLQLSVEYSQELLRNGFANYTEVINARQFLLQAELGRVNDRLQQLQAIVNLYRALGGGESK